MNPAFHPCLLARVARLSRPLLAASVLALAACSGSHEQDAAHMASAGSPSAGLPKGNAAAGEEAAQRKSQATDQSCLDCHGADGNQPLDPAYPRIGGQYRDYLAHALVQYRSGAREHVLMSQQAQELSDQQIADLAVYFSTRPSMLSDLQRAH